MTNVKNPGLAKPVKTIRCYSCTDRAQVDGNPGSCTTIRVNKKATTLIFTEAVLDNAFVKYQSSNNNNGAADSELTVEIQLQNPIVPTGRITLKLPNKNEEYKGLGYNAQGLIYEESDLTSVVVTEGALNSGFYNPVTVKDWVLDDVLDGSGQTLQINLENAAEIRQNRVVYVKIKHITNPPSFAPLQGFEVYTSDQNLPLPYLIEKATGNQLQTTVEGRFEDRSSLKVLGTTMVSATDVEYEF